MSAPQDALRRATREQQGRTDRTSTSKLTAREGADQKHLRERDEPISGERKYRCEQCGSDHFVVRLIEWSSELYSSSLVCGSDRHNHSHGVAAVRQQEYRVTWERLAMLDPNISPSWHHKAVIAKDLMETTVDVECRTCVENADDSDWDEDPDPEVYEAPEDPEWSVECGECGHEIEFGWSAPDREGRICQVESSDFDRAKTWPEPRYRDDWERRGWAAVSDDATED